MALKRKLLLVLMDEKSKDFTKHDFIQKAEALNELKNKVLTQFISIRLAYVQYEELRKKTRNTISARISAQENFASQEIILTKSEKATVT